MWEVEQFSHASQASKQVKPVLKFNDSDPFSLTRQIETKMARNFEVDARIISNLISKELSATCELEDAILLITQLWNCFFTEKTSNFKNFGEDFSFDTEAKNIFMKKYFIKLCENLTLLARNSWFSEIKELEKKTLTSFFLKGPAKEVLIALSNTLNQRYFVNFFASNFEF